MLARIRGVEALVERLLAPLGEAPERLATRDRGDPGVGPGRRAAAPSMPPGPDRCLLRRIVGGARLAEDAAGLAQAQRADPRPVPFGRGALSHSAPRCPTMKRAQRL